MKEFIERFKKVIEGQAGTLSHVDEWGLRDLAYRIQKQGKGLYTLLNRSGIRAPFIVNPLREGDFAWTRGSQPARFRRRSKSWEG